MLSVLRVHLPSDIPIAGCELSPYVLLRKADGTITTDDIPEGNPSDGFYIRYRWYETAPGRVSTQRLPLRPSPLHNAEAGRGLRGPTSFRRDCLHPEGLESTPCGFFAAFALSTQVPCAWRQEGPRVQHPRERAGDNPVHRLP